MPSLYIHLWSIELAASRQMVNASFRHHCDFDWIRKSFIDLHVDYLDENRFRNWLLCHLAYFEFNRNQVISKKEF